MAISSARGGASFLLLVAAAAAAALAGCSTTGKTDPNVPTLFTVDVGYENLDQAYQAQAFFPNALAVNVGDRVAFTSRTHEPHTVTFNAPSPAPDPFVAGPDHGLAANPVVFLPSPASGPLDLTAAADRTASFDGTGFVSSGFLGKPGDTFTVTFTREGTWVGVCLFHAPEMTVTILVNPKGTPRLMADAAYRSAAAAQVKDSQAKAADILDGLRVPGPTQNADGSRSYVVWAGAGNRKDGIDYVRFLGGEQLSVTAGDSVTFDVSRNGAGTRHTVTFPAGADGRPPDRAAEPPRPDAGPAAAGALRREAIHQLRLAADWWADCADLDGDIHSTGHVPVPLPLP